MVFYSFLTWTSGYYLIILLICFLTWTSVYYLIILLICFHSPVLLISDLEVWLLSDNSRS